jgi:hypothetical protein
VDPSTGRVSGGYTFNYEFLPPGVFAKAPGAGAIAEVFLISHYTQKEAEKTAHKHRYFLEVNGMDYDSKYTTREEDGGGGFAFFGSGGHRRVWWGTDPNVGRVICTRYGVYLIGVLAPKSFERGEVILDRIVAEMARRRVQHDRDAGRSDR